MESEGWRGGGDLLGAASGWERSGCCCDGHYSPSYFSDGTLYAVLAAGALAFYVLYSTINMAAGGEADPGANGFFRVKRKAASTFPSSEVTADGDWMLEGLAGLEEFQENIEHRADGQERWISRISDEDSQLNTADEEKCRMEMWRCLSKVVEGGLHYIDNPDRLYRLVQKTLLGASFHGRIDKIWLNIPEARQMKKCSRQHTVCRDKAEG